MIITINEKITSKYEGMNAIYSGVHWTVRKRTADKWKTIVLNALRKQKIKKTLFEKPVEITIAYNTRMDIDNHSYVTKMIIDGFKGYLLHDDNKKFVRRVTQEFHDENNIKITIREITA